MAATSMTASFSSFFPLARQLLPLRVALAPSTRLPPARRICVSLQLLRHCASSSPASREAPSTAAGACAPSEGEPAERGGEDDKAVGAQNNGVTPAAPALRAAPARAGRTRPPSAPKGLPGPPRQSGDAKVHAADPALAKAKGKGRRGKPTPPGGPREGRGGGGGIIHAVPSSATSSSSSSSSSS